MLRLVLKTLITIWPFLKNVIFKDRTVQEVVRANRQFTILFCMLMLVLLTLLLTVVALSDTKVVLAASQREVKKLNAVIVQLKAQCTLPAKEQPVEELQCVTVTYDKSRLIRLLQLK